LSEKQFSFALGIGYPFINRTKVVMVFIALKTPRAIKKALLDA
jgi:hypothetical protein